MQRNHESPYRVVKELYGVLMCDLVGSKGMSAEERLRAADEIRRTVRKLQELFPGVIGNAFEFRFGDEWQLLINRPAQAYTLYSHLFYLLGRYEFYCGIGLGSLSLPVSENTHEVDGPAFHYARAALLTAKANKHQQVAFKLPPHERTDSTEVILHSITGMVTRLRSGRRDTQQEACRMAIVDTWPIAKIAESLGITRSAVSYRLTSAGLKEERAAIEAVQDVLEWFVRDYISSTKHSDVM